MKIAFHTLGCKVNQYETQALKEKFSQAGYEIVDELDFADVYVINTCTVTNLSDRKSRQYIRKVKRINPDSVTAVVGCYAQVSPEEAAAIEGVSIVAGTNEKNNLVEYVDRYVKEKKGNRPADERKQIHIKDYSQLGSYDEMGIITSMEERTRAFIKIQEGCNQFCSYCIIPFARGPVRSRSSQEVVKEAESLIERGFKEIVLTGINTALYGMEEGFEEDWVQEEASEGVRRIYGIEKVIRDLSAVPGDFRIRLSSLEPTVINKDYIKNLLRYEKLCPHLHLSLQSGSDQVLSNMNRSYSRRDYLDIVEALREFDEGFGITTDIIVGFPGETESDFEDSLELVEKSRFCKVHGFKYSKRQGTKAAEMKNQISPEVKARRSERLKQTAELAAGDFFESCLGQRRRVLFELFDEKEGMYRGYADNYIEVYCESQEDITNQFKSVLLVETYKSGVRGQL